MRPTLTLLILATLVQACTLTPPTPMPDPAPQPDLASCHATGLQGLVGGPVSLLPADGAWSALRVIKPGQMVTMDYSATRLNVTVDNAGTVLTVACG